MYTQVGSTLENIEGRWNIHRGLLSTERSRDIRKYESSGAENVITAAEARRCR